MQRLLGLNGNRHLTPFELQQFLIYREKIISKFWSDPVIVPSNFQIQVFEAIGFVVNLFSKDMPQVGMLTLSYLYLANNKSTADIMGYSLLYLN